VRGSPHQIFWWGSLLNYALAVIVSVHIFIKFYCHIKPVNSIFLSVCVARVLACFNFFLLSVGEKF